MDEQSPLDVAIARAEAAEALAAEYGLALDILGRLTGVTSEAAVVDVVLEFAQVMFGADRSRMIMLDRWGRSERAWERGLDGVVAEIEPPAGDARNSGLLEVIAGGLHVPVMAGDRHMARIEIEDLPAPGEAARYTTTIWIIAEVAAMA
ncbi:MAG: hypothetical protein WCK58_04890, partial [Chloroflexota bacterium]